MFNSIGSQNHFSSNPVNVFLEAQGKSFNIHVPWVVVQVYTYVIMYQDCSFVAQMLIACT